VPEPAGGLSIERLTSLEPGVLAELVERGRSALGESALDEWLLPVIAGYGYLFVGRIGGGIAGSAEVIRCASDDDLYLEGFYILPAHQGRGLGRMLLSGVMERLAAMGYRRLLATLDPVNAAARQLYAGAGFRELDQLPDHYGPGRDRLLLAAALAGEEEMT